MSAPLRTNSGLHESNAYQITFNGLAIDPGTGDREVSACALARLPGVKAVYLDRIYQADLYTSTTLIDAPAVWNSAGWPCQCRRRRKDRLG